MNPSTNHNVPNSDVHPLRLFHTCQLEFHRSFRFVLYRCSPLHLVVAHKETASTSETSNSKNLGSATSMLTWPAALIRSSNLLSREKTNFEPGLVRQCILAQRYRSPSSRMICQVVVCLSSKSSSRPFQLRRSRPDGRGVDGIDPSSRQQ